jgi:hypothetical protein
MPGYGKRRNYSASRRSRNNRSAVSNGNRLFAPDVTDGRTCAARRFRDILEQIQYDLGGADRLSEGQRQLCRRAATMSMQCELMEAEAVAGRAFDVDCFCQLTDRLGRCLQRLGLERIAKPVNDGSHALAEYFSRPPPKEGAAP